jgi:hypothetical protein
MKTSFKRAIYVPNKDAKKNELDVNFLKLHALGELQFVWKG